MNIKNFGKKLKRVMENEGHSQISLAKLIRPDNPTSFQSMLSRYINGKSIPEPETIETLAKALNVTAEYLTDVETQEIDLDDYPQIKSLSNIVYLYEISGVRCGNFALTYDPSIDELLMRAFTRDILPIKDQNKHIKELQKKYFVFFAEGDSMTPEIEHGSMLLVEIKPPSYIYQSGEIIIAGNHENELICRRVGFKGEEMYLVPENQTTNFYKPLKLEEHPDIRMLGLVIHKSTPIKRKKPIF